MDVSLLGKGKKIPDGHIKLQNVCLDTLSVHVVTGKAFRYPMWFIRFSV